VIKINENTYHLNAFDALVVENINKENITLDFSNECLFGVLDF